MRGPLNRGPLKILMGPPRRSGRLATATSPNVQTARPMLIEIFRGPLLGAPSL